jgi:hypothetical protein
VMNVELRNRHDVVSAIEGRWGALGGSGFIWRNEVLGAGHRKTSQGGSCRTTCDGSIRGLVGESGLISPNKRVCRSNFLTKALLISTVSPSERRNRALASGCVMRS